MDDEHLVEKYRAMGESEIEAEMYKALRKLAKAYREAMHNPSTWSTYRDVVENCVAIGESISPGETDHG